MLGRLSSLHENTCVNFSNPDTGIGSCTLFPFAADVFSDRWLLLEGGVGSGIERMGSEGLRECVCVRVCLNCHLDGSDVFLSLLSKTGKLIHDENISCYQHQHTYTLQN